MAPPVVTRLEYFTTQIFTDKNNQPCEIKTATGSAGAGTANNSLVAAVSGKRIRVISGEFGSNGAGLSFQSFLSNNTTVLGWINAPSNASASPMVVLPLNPAGWFETLTGEGLTYNVGTTQALIAIRYIEVTP